MVRRFRKLAAVSGALLDDLLLGLVSPRHAQEDGAPIDLLVKNALREDVVGEADVSRVWADLSSRVKGPFGRLAVEGPAFTCSEGRSLTPALQSREGLDPSPDGSSPMAPPDDIYSATLFKGASSHQLNIR